MSRFGFLQRIDWWMCVLGGALIGSGASQLSIDGTGWLRIFIGVGTFAAGMAILAARHKKLRP
ncbi:hypothetical protein [Salmonella enterica]|uniref:hypothetical protein n=1 Tax=Salmonella enterica TaxID=28901 RepID=UPI0011BE3BF8|nr:hypothetical protein [Salmonella enterica]TXC45600.1 hypothetical protein DP142_25670 [Salmonella enterica subsp. enterica serovar Typhimurium]